MELLIINLGMTISLIFFFLGYFYRIKANHYHRRFNTIGIAINLITAIYLLAGKYFLGGIESMNIYPIVPNWVVQVHRFFAAIALCSMIFMGVTGWLRKLDAHKKVSMPFLVLYTIIYISGLIIFKTGN